MYAYWADKDKKQLLDYVKVLRNDFRAEITKRLKPYGFRKRGNIWIKSVGERYTLGFNMSKSSYADVYQFEWDLYVENMGGCFCEVLRPIDKYWYDWQLDDQENFLARFEAQLENIILPITYADFEELGKEEYIQGRCFCSRENCASCWVERNLWELQEAKGWKPLEPWPEIIFPTEKYK